jgi:YVTN family beta-propeller protein
MQVMITVLSAAFKRRLLPKELLAIGVIAFLFSVTTAERVDEHFSPSSTALSNETLFAQWAYVPSGVNKVSVIDVLTSTVIKVIPVTDSPDAVVISPDGTRVYVTHSTGVSVIDTRTNTAIDFILVGYPRGIAITPDGTQIYVVNSPGNNISVIDVATRTVVSIIKAGSSPRRIVITSDGTRAYMTNLDGLTVSVIDTKTRTVIATMNLSGMYNDGGDIAVTLDGAWVYTQGGGGVSAFNTQTHVRSDITVNSARETGRGIAVNPDGIRVGVATFTGTVSIIDTRTLAVIDTIQVRRNNPNGLYGIAFTLDGAQAYVVNSNDGSVSIIDLKASSAITTIEGVGARRYVAIGRIPQ